MGKTANIQTSKRIKFKILKTVPYLYVLKESLYQPYWQLSLHRSQKLAL
jgi:hypothetical protein